MLVTLMRKINATNLLIDKIHEISNSNLYEKELKESKLRILDWFGGYLSSKYEAPIDKIVSVFKKNHEGASVYLVGEKFKSRDAAFINGYLGHYFEMDDVHKEAIIHPGAIIIPVVLAIVEDYKLDLTYKEFNSFIIAGYEAIVKLGISLNPSHYVDFHTTGTSGTIAAAIIASLMLSKDKRVNITAANMATTLASGLISSFGFDSKLVTVGNACMSGIMAAEFANIGLSANPDALENGFYKAYSNEDKLIETIRSIDLNNLEINNSYYKMHASCGHTHSALDAAIKIMSENKVDVESIKEVNIYTYGTSVEITNKPEYGTRQQCQFSNPFCMSLLLINGRVSIQDFEVILDGIGKEKIMKLVNKINVYEDKEYTKMYPKRRPSRVEVIIDNEILEAEQILPEKYDDEKLIKSKFLSLTENILSETQSLKIIDLILKFDDNQSVRKFISYLGKYIKE